MKMNGICDDCIELCSEILEEEFADQEKGPDFSGINLLKPKEIKEFLDEYVIGQDDGKNLFLPDINKTGIFQILNQK